MSVHELPVLHTVYVMLHELHDLLHTAQHLLHEREYLLRHVPDVLDGQMLLHLVVTYATDRLGYKLHPPERNHNSPNS